MIGSEDKISKLIIIDNQYLFDRSRDSFPSYSDISMYEIPYELNINEYLQEAELTLKIIDAKIIDERPLIEIQVLCKGRYNYINLGYYEKYVDMFVTNDNIIRISSYCIENLKKLLRRSEINDLSRVTLRQYIDLVKNDSDELIDYSSLDNIKIDSLKDIMGPIDSPLFIGTPYDYQMDGIRWMWLLCKEKLGLLLGDEMGLGKTFQIIYLFCLSKEKSQLPHLVVCPATLVSNWTREIQKFAPELDVYEHKGRFRRGSKDFLASKDIVVTSYDTLIIEADFKGIFLKIDWEMVILDEAQAIKNPDSYRGIAVKQLKSNSRIAVTGTPLENRMLDIWSLFDFSLPGFLDTEIESFKTKFPDSTKSARRLEQSISPFILRRLISNVKQDLPKLIKIEHLIELEPLEKTNYQEFVSKITGGGDNEDISLEHYQDLRMYCTHPNIAKKNLDKIELLSYSKLKRLIELLEEIRYRKQKAVIFVSFREMIDILNNFIKTNFSSPDSQLNPYVNYIDGRNSSSALDIIDDFSAKDGFGILLLNPRAAGTGLTITSANHVFHYNPEWNPALVDQATARVHRIGQEHEVISHYLFAKDTVEEEIKDKLEFKRDLFDAAIKGVRGQTDDEATMISSIIRTADEE
ncbi:DEAD/DEAH box helicase [Euryarchaeota archaeon]|nr:DEAD/DEAH box helicase [Euryarchaeota archaeon]